MTSRRWAWGTALAIPGVLALAWLMVPTDSPPGLVRIAGEVPPSQPSLPVVPGRVPTAIATEAAPLTPAQRNAEVAAQSNYLVVREKRDAVWADRSETAILNLMRGISYVGRGRRLEIKCTASMCEVSGIADEDPATGSMGPIWAALDRDTGGDVLVKFGLERAATTFGTGRVREEFEIYYRRFDRARI